MLDRQLNCVLVSSTLTFNWVKIDPIIHYGVTHQLATSFKSLFFFLTIAVEIICTFFKDQVQLFFLMWQVGAEPSCVQMRSHDTIVHPIFPSDMPSAKIVWCEHKSQIKISIENRLAYSNCLWPIKKTNGLKLKLRKMVFCKKRQHI